VFAVLGDIPFQVVGSPEALSDSRGYDYAEHRVVQARPRLQWLADDLVTIRLEMLLHRSFTEPAASLLILRQAASTHAALPLVFGNGDFRGYFVITRIDTLLRQLSGLGDLFAVTVRLSLVESPIEFDSAMPPIPSFLPIAVVAAAPSGSSSAAARASTGVSALLLALTAPSGPASPILLADDVSTSTIVRSAQ
jgi:phage protein U